MEYRKGDIMRRFKLDKDVVITKDLIQNLIEELAIEKIQTQIIVGIIIIIHFMIILNYPKVQLNILLEEN